MRLAGELATGEARYSLRLWLGLAKPQVGLPENQNRASTLSLSGRRLFSSYT
jgi:hypothetical protein